MADGAVAEFDGIGRRDEDLACVGDGKRNEIVSALGKRSRERGRDDADEMREIGFRDAGFAPRSIVDAVGGGTNVDLRSDLFSGP